MLHDHPPADRRAEITRRLDDALAAAATDQLHPIWRDILDRPDRWYGQLLVCTHGALAPDPNPRPVLSAATAIELLREYCRLRSELLTHRTDATPQSITHELTSGLLAGDYLHSSAYATLSDVDPDHRGPCIETLTDAATTLTHAFYTAYSHPDSTDHQTLIDETAGTLGRTAAQLGAMLADADQSHRTAAATFGYGASTTRQIHRILDPDTGPTDIILPSTDDPDLRQHAEQRRNDARQALQTLPPTVDRDVLHPFVPIPDTRKEQ